MSDHVARTKDKAKELLVHHIRNAHVARPFDADIAAEIGAIVDLIVDAAVAQAAQERLHETKYKLL